MSELHYSQTPPPRWEERCEEQASLFHHPDWHRVLAQGFGASTLYVEADDGTAYAVDIFKAGPFRIGYLGFPAGGTLKGLLDRAQPAALRRARLPLDLLRIPASGFDSQPDMGLPSANTPETAISNLSEWSLATLPKLRRDLAKARHTSFELRDMTYGEDAALTLYSLYRETVLGHGGSLRYTPAYFRALLALAARSSQLRCLAAFHGQELCGYVVIAHERDTAYYLHGATAAAWKPSGVSDLLLYDAIEQARQQGMQQFNLMSSSAAQPGLIRYKEKFGATTVTHRTYELSLAPLRSRMFKGLLWLREQGRRSRSPSR